MEILEEIVATKFVSVKREPQSVIAHQHNLVDGFLAIKPFVDDINQMIIILNKSRQIVYANKLFLNFIGNDYSFGQRLGEVLNCTHSHEKIGGCGVSESCSSCGQMNAIINSQKFGLDEQECRITSENNTVYDLNVWAKSISISNLEYTIVSIADISSEKRKKVLERLFFHDILNTAGSLKNFLELMQDCNAEELKEYSALTLEISETLIEELKAQRMLGLAEDSKLLVDITKFNAASVFTEIVCSYNNSVLSDDKNVKLINANDNILHITTDKILLKRVLGNLVKNALEASESGGEVTSSIEEFDSTIAFSVHNSTYIPKDIQMQIFQRSFSTKGTGRGIGTYSVKLLTEKYLQGDVAFFSTEEFGTTFYITIPKEI